MLAYNTNILKNIAIVKKAKQWYGKQFISKEQLLHILKNYSEGFYSPHLFIKIGLFIFTCIAILVAMGFFLLFFKVFYSQTAFFVFTCVAFALLCTWLLELFIKNKRIYQAGVDECLLYSALGFAFSAVLIATDGDYLLLSCMFAAPLLLAAIIRYADRIVTLACAVCLYAIFFLSLMKLGEIAKAIMPFALMAVSIFFYLTVIKQKQRTEFFHWKKCFVVFEYVTLSIFYLSGNYFVIRESSIEFFDLELQQGEDIPLAILFYILTVVVPLLYIYFGLKKKNKILLWTGLLFVAATVLTFKYYFSLGHPEITLTIAGLLMILIAYFCIRALQKPIHGITFEEDIDENSSLLSNAEALAIAQNFGQQGQVPTDTKLGGGDFGGAGAGGKF